MRYLYSLFILSLSLSAFSKEGDVGCSLKDQNECKCVASITVQCGEKVGYIKNTTKVSTLKFLITNKNGSTRDYVLENPEGTVADNIKLDNELLKRKVELKAGETIAIAENGLIFDPSTILFKDYDAKEELGAISSAPANSDFCQYDEKPMLLDYPEACGKKKICSMDIKCKFPKVDKYKNFPEGEFRAVALCPSHDDGSCPLPTNCAIDEKVTFQDEEKSTIGTGKVEQGKSDSSKQ